MVKYGILHTHSEYSIHDSTQSPEELVQQAKKLGCKNLTLTDHATLLGIDDFMDAGKKYQINTIPGVELYLEDRLHLVIIAKNYHGFQEISRVLKEANEHQLIKKIKGRSFVYPIVTHEILESLRGSEDVIVSSACIQGPVCYALLEKYYMDEYNKKILDKMNIYTDDVESYKRCLNEIKEVEEKIALYRENRREFSKYTTKSYQARIEKKQQKLETNQALVEKLTEVVSTKEEIRRNNALFQVQTLTAELKEMKKLNRTSIEIVDQADEMIKVYTNQKKKLMASKKIYKKQKDRYDSLNQKILVHPECTEEEMYEKAKSIACFLRDLFPYFYLELQNHGLPQESYAMPFLVRISKETGIPLIAANDAHMSDQSEENITARQLVRFNYFAKHQEVSEPDKELYLKTDAEMLSSLTKIVDEESAKEALENTKILEECRVIFPQEKHYPTCACDKSFEELLEDAREKMIASGNWDEEHEQRLKHEIYVIKKMGYVDYHMVVRDFCIAGRNLGVVPKQELQNMPVDYKESLKWIKEKGYNTGVGVGPGRGSAAGSLVCYLLGITNLDPLKYNLLFERFLNPERVSMPDIDTDIKTSLRPYIIRYCKQQYGENAVSSIATTNTYAAKAAIQMAGRDRADELYGHLPNTEQNEKKRKHLAFTRKISNLIPEGSGDKLQDWEYEFKKQFSNNEEAIIIWNRAKLIEGHVNGCGVHAGGIVISDNDNINDYVPLMWKDDMKVWATQCDMIRVEEKGMLKMDILGLLTLDVISDCVNLVKKNTGVSIDLDHLPFEEEVFKNIYATGKTNSVFQVESKGMKDMLKQFGPTCFEDIILLLAMYRPGPMQFIPNVIAVKHGQKELTYKTPLLEPILKDTYGAVAYQEQVMQLFQVLAGYSLGQADMVRRAMSKKKEEKLKIERKAFVYGDEERNIKGCLKNKISEEVSNEIFDEVMDFAKYAFNKSHAAAYAYVSYQTAWLKYHYPLEFLCSMFNNKSLDQFESILEDCVSHGIELLPPDINLSDYDFQTEGKSIRYGFRGIKGIADPNAISAMVKERKRDIYRSFSDFVERFLEEKDGKRILFDKGIMESLIRTGCFDSIFKNRVLLNDIFEEMNLKQDKESILAYLRNQEELPEQGTSLKQKQAWELEYLKQYISSNPLKVYREDSYYGCVPYSNLQNGRSSVFGLVIGCDIKISSNGNRFMIVHLMGKTGKMDVLFFRKKCEYYERFVEELEGTVVRVDITVKDGSCFGNRIERLPASKTTYFITCDTEEMYRNFLKVFEQNRGMEDLDVFTYYHGYGTETSPIKPLEKPMMVRVKVNRKILKIFHCI